MHYIPDLTRSFRTNGAYVTRRALLILVDLDLTPGITNSASDESPWICNNRKLIVFKLTEIQRIQKRQIIKHPIETKNLVYVKDNTPLEKTLKMSDILRMELQWTMTSIIKRYQSEMTIEVLFVGSDKQQSV